MASTTFHCKLITREAVLLDQPAHAAVVPAWDGSFGVLPGRAPMVARLGTGALRLDFPDQPNAKDPGAGKGGSRSYFLDGGFVQMVDNALTILTEQAVPAESLQLADAEAELAEAEARITEGMDREQIDAIHRDKERARVKVRIARAFRAQGGI